MSKDISAYRFQVLSCALEARGNVRSRILQGQAVPITVNKPVDEIHAHWKSTGFPEQWWSKASYFLDRWIDGFSRFVAPTDERVRSGVRQEMWNNPKIWEIAAKWAMTSPWEGPIYEYVLHPTPTA